MITGANSGIGFEAAKHFARNGANVVMACRSLDKAEKAQSDLLREIPQGNIQVIRLDVSDPNSVQDFSRQFIAQIGQLDVLINNAGIVAIPLARNSAGHEMQLATNYLGAFGLTGLLLPYFRRDTQGRIVNVGSLMHRTGKLSLDDFNWENGPYDQWQAYARSKVAMMSYTLELNRRLQQSGSNIIALGAHPGFANTSIYEKSPTLQARKKESGSSWFKKKMEAMIPLADSAVKPIILAAESPKAAGGDYWGPGGIMETGIWGKVSKAKINKIAKDPVAAKRLWSISETMTGVRYLSEL